MSEDTSHIYHQSLDGYDKRQIWFDGCPECERRGQRPLAYMGNLDNSRFGRAWERAARLHMDGDVGEISAAESPLLDILWAVQVMLERVGNYPLGELPNRMRAPIGSEPQGGGFGKPWAPQPGVTFLAAGALVRTVIEVEPGPPQALLAVDVEGKWNHGAKDTLSMLVLPDVALEWATFMVECVAACPGDEARYKEIMDVAAGGATLDDGGGE